MQYCLSAGIVQVLKDDLSAYIAFFSTPSTSFLDNGLWSVFFKFVSYEITLHLVPIIYTSSS